MIDRFLEIFGLGALHKVGMVTGVASQVIRTFEQELAQNHTARNACIDALIELLQKHKDIPTPAPAPVEEPKA